MDSHARETRTPHRHYHVLLSIAGFVNRVRRYEHGVHPTADHSSAKWTEIALPTEGMFVRACNFHHGVRGKRGRSDIIHQRQ